MKSSFWRVIAGGVLFSAVWMQGLTVKSANAEDVLRMGTEGAYPPFNEVDKNGKVFGFDIDIGNALCAEMKRNCEWVVQDWEGIIPALLAKKFDTIVASMSITADRKKTINFSSPYYQTPASFFAKKGVYKDISEATFKGKTVGVQTATIHQSYMQGKYPKVSLKTYATLDELVLDLQAGRVDIGFADSFAVNDTLLAKPDGDKYELFGGPVYSKEYLGEGVGVGVRKDDKALLEALNKAIKTIHDNGTYKKINDRYFKSDLWPKE